jgi:histidyl-tRNA synthetase
LAMKQQRIFKKDLNDEFEDLNYIVYDSIEIFDYVERLASYLRRNNFPVDYDLSGRSFSKQIAEAENKKSKKIIIVSKENLEKDSEVMLRDAFQKMDKKIKITKDFDELVYELVKIRLR